MRQKVRRFEAESLYELDGHGKQFIVW